jgi:hypothetical protein
MTRRLGVCGQTSIIPKFHRYFNDWSVLAGAQGEIERMKRPESRCHPDITAVQAMGKGGRCHSAPLALLDVGNPHMNPHMIWESLRATVDGGPD